MRSPSRALTLTLLFFFTITLTAQSHSGAKKTTPMKTPHASAAAAKPTAEQAQKFIDGAETQLSDLADKQQRADWVNETYITDDTDALATDANSEQSAVTTKLALDAKRFEGVALAPVYERKLHLLKLQLTLPTPSDPALLREENALKTDMQSTYGKGKYCPESKPGTCY